MVDQQQGYRIISVLQPSQQVQSGAPGVRPQDAVTLIVALLQIALDGVEDVEIVIYRQYDWFSHRR
jgi:hypothetical protein